MLRPSGLLALLAALLAGACRSPAEGMRAPDAGGMVADVAAAPVDTAGRQDAGAAAEAAPRDTGAAPGDAGPPADVAGADDAARVDARAADGRPADSAVSTGDAAGAAACPPAPSVDQPWITEVQTALIAHLTGEMELSPGIRITDRASTRTRQLAREHVSAAWRELGITAQLQDYGSGANLFARLDATTGGAARPQVVLGAHLDSVANSPGANDNATGVAVVHAVGRYLKQLPCRSRPVVLVLFDEEEVGLVGSKQFARKLVEDGAAVHSVHSVDQVGWDRDGDRLFELERPDPGLFELYDAAVKALGVDLPLMVTRTGATDHVSFRPSFPAVGLTEGYRSGDTSPHRHKNTDRLSTVDLAYLRSATLLVGRVLAELVR